MMCGVLLYARGRGARDRRTKEAGEVVTIYTAEGQSCAAGHEKKARPTGAEEVGLMC